MAVHAEAHFETLAKQEHAARLGMWLFIASEVLFFAALFTLYASYRSMYPHDFAEASKHSIVWAGTLNTFVLITSSATIALSIWAGRAGRVGLGVLLQAVTLVFACVFLGLKAYEYTTHFHEGIGPGPYLTLAGIGPGERIYFNLYYVMTGLHALHVVAGLVLVAWVLRRTMKGRYSAEYYLGPDLAGLYWHLVDLIWIFLWPMFYLVH